MLSAIIVAYDIAPEAARKVLRIFPGNAKRLLGGRS
jgi:hypothetical protein